MKYVGEYRINIKDEKINFPWEINPEQKKIWLIMEHRNDADSETLCLILDGKAYEELTAEVIRRPKDFRFVAKGRFVTDKNNTWHVPEAVLNFTKNNEIIFVGNDEKIEIYNGDYYDEIKNRF